jgi:eukaryotic-like serine/threonine-protein kinase
LLGKCLQKDTKKRLRDIGDWTQLLDSDPSSTAPLTSGADPRHTQSADKDTFAASYRAWRPGRGGWVAAAVFALIAATLAFIHFREASPGVRPTVFSTIPGPANASLAFLALSPDGRSLVVGDSVSLYVRALDSPQWRQLSGTNNARAPFWPPDSKSIGFFANRKLKTISAA